MKTFISVVLTLAVINLAGGERQAKRSSVLFKNEESKDFALNKGEYVPESDKFSDDLSGFEDQYGLKVKQKNNFKPQVQNGNHHYVIMKQVKKYPAVKQEEPKKVMKYVSQHKPKKMTAKVVQQGSVQHIYLDIPDSEPIPQPSMQKGYSYIPQDFNHNKGFGSNQHQFESNNYYQKQPIRQHIYPSNGYSQFGSGFASPGYSNGFSSVSSGFRVGKAQQINPGANGLGAYASHGTKYTNNFKYPPPQYGKFKAIPNPTPLHNIQTAYYQQYAAPHSYQFGSTDGHQTHQHITHQTEQQIAAPQFQPLTQNEHQSNGDSSTFSNAFNLPQFSADGKEKFTYEIPKEYQHLFAGNAASAENGGLKEQLTELSSKDVNNFAFANSQQQFDFGKYGNLFGQPTNNVFSSQSHQLPGKQNEEFKFQSSVQNTEFLPKPSPLQQFDLTKQSESLSAQNFGQNTDHLTKTSPVQFTQQNQFDFFKQIDSLNTQNFGQNTEFLPKPSAFQQFDLSKQSESINSQNYGQTEFIPKAAPLTQYQQQYSAGNGEEIKPINEFGQSSDFIPKIAPFNQFNIQQQYEQKQEEVQNQAGLENVSGFDPNLVNIVNDVLNKGEGVPTANGFRMIKSSKDNAIYLVGKPGMSLDAIPNLGGFTPSTFQINSGQNNDNNPGKN